MASEVKIDKTLVWTRFSYLDMIYYDESFLLALATAVGLRIRVNIRTMEASRGKFARVCIEINLHELVVGQVWFHDRWFNVQYEGLHLFCKRCGIFGHTACSCQTSNGENMDMVADKGMVMKKKDGTGMEEKGQTGNHANLSTVPEKVVEF